MLPEWRPANNGAGKRTWFLVRGYGSESDRIPISERYYYNKRDDLIRYATMESAQKAADRLNLQEKALNHGP